jgi:hypothetical protein
LAAPAGSKSGDAADFGVAARHVSMTFAARTITTLAAVLAALSVVVQPAFSSAIGVIRDCSEDGVLNGKYSTSDLEGALEQLPSDLDEYTDCRAVIRRAQLGSAGGHSAAKRPAVADRVDAAAPPSAKERREIDKATGSGAAVRIGGTGVRPGESGAPFKSAGFGTDLPPLVLVVLIALAASTLAGAALTGRRHLAGVKRGISRFRR